MDLDNPTTLIGSISLIGSALYVVGRWKENSTTAIIAKAAASSAFVVLAVANGAIETRYGRLILAALVFCWFGDMLLLSLKSSFLLAGIAAFFIAHIVFAIAFATNTLKFTAVGVALAVAVIFGILILRWLWRYLNGFYRIAVPLYLIAIAAMVALAVAVSLPSPVAIGAIAFAVSDISVARDRFVEKSIANKIWGLPLYYFAQVLLASSVSAQAE